MHAVTLHLPTITAGMAHPIPRLLSRRLCQPSSFLLKHQSPIPRTFRPQLPKSPARRTYATGESGPNPKPGQNPFKIWPFIAITLAGSGAYVLMVRSRAGMLQLLHSGLIELCCTAGAQFESRFKNQQFEVKRPRDHIVILYPALHPQLPELRLIICQPRYASNHWANRGP
jgi:hypothetical protein